MDTIRQKAQDIARLMGQLANENRLLILCALLEGPQTVGQLGQQVPGITGPALSQHLHRLRDSGLVQAQKQGQFVTYSLRDERLRAVMAALKEQYCAPGLGDKTTTR